MTGRLQYYYTKFIIEIRPSLLSSRNVTSIARTSCFGLSKYPTVSFLFLVFLEALQVKIAATDVLDMCLFGIPYSDNYFIIQIKSTYFVSKVV